MSCCIQRGQGWSPAFSIRDSQHGDTINQPLNNTMNNKCPYNVKQHEQQNPRYAQHFWHSFEPNIVLPTSPLAPQQQPTAITTMYHAQ
jgi:hypothetical protein